MKLVEIRMLTKGPNGQYRKGQIVTVDEIRAALLVTEKHGEEVTHGDIDRT
jgi:hypothetical protein